MHQGHLGEVVLEKFTQGAFFLQPLGGRALATWGAHSTDDVAERLGLLSSTETCFFEDLRDLEVLEGFQRNGFGAHRSGFDLLDGIEINFLKISGIPGSIIVVQLLNFAPTGDDLRVKVLGSFLVLVWRMNMTPDD
ncbi:MAG: hypothetical protein ACJAQT_004108 [Akkermansiaceae bacterium]